MKHRIFVYGTLKQGFGNHKHFLGNNGVEFVGRGSTTHRYDMYDTGGFPVTVVGKEVGHVKGEVYEVEPLVMQALDRLEGHPRFYCREEVDIDIEGDDVRKCWMYFGTPEYWQNAIAKLKPVTANTDGYLNWREA